jgi:hypothetical protein
VPVTRGTDFHFWCPVPVQVRTDTPQHRGTCETALSENFPHCKKMAEKSCLLMSRVMRRPRPQRNSDRLRVAVKEHLNTIFIIYKQGHICRFFLPVPTAPVPVLRGHPPSIPQNQYPGTCTGSIYRYPRESSSARHENRGNQLPVPVVRITVLATASHMVCTKNGWAQTL